ncbi:MAG: 1-acyl-sn-glycerol-3-phosphate acyltransferase [Bacteroidales bacterium]|nr:1-acyl-sn-glycerol-3-phosphate acyltransferase [Bacteroidales bacterium]
MKPVENYSVGINAARYWVRFTSIKLFYRSWKMRGLDNIDPNRPKIFIANHQNALMDALNVGFLLKAQPIFLARADIFEKKSIARIFNWMKMIPIYRIRDGFDSLQKNDEVFEQCARVLGKGMNLVIFPEGNHGDQRHLRAFKKGMARVAFGAEKARDNKLNLDIIPVGIDYSHYENFRARVTLSVGNPVAVEPFSELHKENAQKGLKALNEEVRKNLVPHMIDVPWKNIYDGVMGVRTLYGARYAKKNSLPYKTSFNRFDADKSLIANIGASLEKSPEKTEAVCKKTATYFKILNRSKLRDHIPANAPYGTFRLFRNLLFLTIGLPFFLYGLINNFLIFLIPDRLSRSLIKDPQFRSSIAYVLAFVVLMPIFYTLQTLIIHWTFDLWWAPWVYLLSLIPFGLFAIYYSFWFKKARAKVGYSIKSRKKDTGLMKLLDLRKSLIEELDQLIV